MEFDNIHRYYLRTSTTPDGKGYPTLADARVALDNLVNAQSVDASSVTEEPNGKWVIRHGSAGSGRAGRAASRQYRESCGLEAGGPAPAAMSLSTTGKRLYLFDVNLDGADEDMKPRRRDTT